MWIWNKRTGEYECLSPAEAKNKIHLDNSWKDTQSKDCSCGTENHRDLTRCKNCGKKLRS